MKLLCPACKTPDGTFEIHGYGLVECTEVTADGDIQKHDSPHDVTWDPDDYAGCNECGWHGEVTELSEAADATNAAAARAARQADTSGDAEEDDSEEE